MMDACCPNHGCQLQSTGNPTVGKCPISSCLFQVDVDQAEGEQLIDKFGNPYNTFKVFQLDGEGG